MEKKIGDILEAFQNYRFEDALRQIDQLMKKISKDNKKKSTLTQKDNRIIHIIKCGCLASVGRIHQANQLIESFFTQKVLSEISPEQTFLFLSIAQLSYDSNILKKVEQFNKTGKADIRLQRFMLSHRMFSTVSKSFLKQFAINKRQEDGLAQIFLEYMNQLGKKKKIQETYSRDLKIQVYKDMNLKMVELFFMKYLSGIDISKLQNVKLRQSIIDLKIRLSLNSNRVEEAKAIYQQYGGLIRQQNHFLYLRSIRDSKIGANDMNGQNISELSNEFKNNEDEQIKRQNQGNLRFYFEGCGRIFKKNVQIEKYVPLYDYYNEFLDIALANTKTQLADTKSQLVEIQQNQKHIQQNEGHNSWAKWQLISSQQLYNFKQLPLNKIISHYYNSLHTQLHYLTSEQTKQKYSNSDYYKISIKGLILQQLRIHYQLASNHSKAKAGLNKNPTSSINVKDQDQTLKRLSENNQFIKLLDLYYINFGKTLTYLNEMKSYLPLLLDKAKQIIEKSINWQQAQKRTGSILQDANEGKQQKSSVSEIKKDRKYKLPEQFNRQDDNLIVLANALKILVVLDYSPSSSTSLNKNINNFKRTGKWIHLAWDYYNQFMLEVENCKKREKGEVFLSDEFMVIICDLAIWQIQSVDLGQSKEDLTISKQHYRKVQQILNTIMPMIDYATQISPFNGYLKLRLMYFCNKLNYFDKLVDTFLSLDIKSVQFQTLGYYFINTLNHFNLYTQYEHVLIKIIRSYHQNQRQTSEYCLKGLKAGTSHQVFQYFSYQKRLSKSWSKIVLFYTLYLQHQKEESSLFYLNWVEEQLNAYREENRKINFNCDTKTFSNLIQQFSNEGESSEFGKNRETLQFSQYYGHLNSVEAFQLQIKMRKLQALCKKEITALQKADYQASIGLKLKQILGLYVKLQKTDNILDLYDLSNQFSFLDQYLGVKPVSKDLPNKKCQNITFTQLTLKKYFLFYLKLIQLKILFFEVIESSLFLIKQSDNHSKHLILTEDKKNTFLAQIQSIFKYILANLEWNQQVKNCWILRQTLFSCYNLISFLDEEVGRVKKLPKPIKQFVQTWRKQTQELIMIKMVDLKISQNVVFKRSSWLDIEVPSKYVQKINERNDILRRWSVMDQKQIKHYLMK